MKKAVSIGLCLLTALLCSCGVRSGVTGTPSAPEVDYSQLHQLTGRYDNYGGGLPPESGQLHFIMGILEEQGLRADFTGEDQILHLKTGDFEQLRGLYFADSVTSDYNEESLYSWYYYPDQVILEPFETIEEEGGLSALYGRFALDAEGNRHWLYPVRYSVERHTLAAEEIPPLMEGVQSPGNQVYRIRQVENIRDLGQAKEIYSRFGYSELVEERRYELRTPEDILQMAERVNSGLYREVTATYSLVSDIDMTGVTFSPIGTNQTPIDHHDARNPLAAGFNGTVDGNGFAIQNLHLVGERQPDIESVNNFGFFSVIGNGGYIRNLRIENADVSYRGEGLSNVSAGILAASLRGGRIENTFVSGKVEGITEVGGLCGYAGGDFWSPTASSNNPSMGVIDRCQADVEVRGDSALGGLVGTSHRVSIENSHAKGVVITEGRDGSVGGNVGGFAGHNVWATILQSSAAVEVKTLTPASCVGSFVGLNEGDIYSCFYLGALSHWKPSGDSPRAELSNDVVGLDRREFNVQKERLAGGPNTPAA